MGNRAVITTRKRDLGVYLHWNGGRDSVGAFLEYCELRGFRSPDNDPYGLARLCQVVANFMGAEGLSVGISRCLGDARMDPGDNGVYAIEGWRIAERLRTEYGPGWEPIGMRDVRPEEEQRAHDRADMRSRVELARAAAGGEAEFRSLLATMAVEVSDASTAGEEGWDEDRD